MVDSLKSLLLPMEEESPAIVSKSQRQEFLMSVRIEGEEKIEFIFHEVFLLIAL